MFPLGLGFVKAYYFLNPNVPLFKKIDTFLFLKTVLQTEQCTKNGSCKQEKEKTY